MIHDPTAKSYTFLLLIRPWSIVDNLYIKLDYFGSIQKDLFIHMLPGSTSPVYIHMIPGPTSLVYILMLLGPTSPVYIPFMYCDLWPYVWLIFKSGF